MQRLIIVAMVVALAGCSYTRPSDPSYEQYLATVAASTKPLVKITWDETGSKMTSLEVNQAPVIQQRAPEAPHPAWGVAKALIGAAGVVGGIWAGGEALQGVIEASRGVTTYTAGGSIAHGDVSIPTTTTTTTTETTTTENTETITNPEPVAETP